MRRCLELLTLLGTAAVILASENPNLPPPRRCEPVSVTLHADTTCGPPAELTVSTTASCGVTVANAELAGLPAASPSWFQTDLDAGLSAGFVLEGVVDGGDSHNCVATATDAGLAIDCDWSEECDGGPNFVGILACPLSCSGTLSAR